MGDQLPGGEPVEQPAVPPFDKEAARRRYRATMRSPIMRLLYALLGLIIIISWGVGIAAVLAADVEQLPNHSLLVPPRECVGCHTQRLGNAPAIPHVVFPSCGFCHRQGMPPTATPLVLTEKRGK